MYEGKGRKRRKKRASELDAHVEEMTALLSRPGTSVKAAYWFLKNERGIRCSYDNFKRFARAKGISEKAKAAVPHPLYETDPGQQLQVDWVESMRLTTTKGETLEFNLFSATLGYSRLHYFEYTEFKQEVDFKRCLFHAFERLGGMTREVLTDNMSAVVSCTGGGKRKLPQIRQLESDLGCKVVLCRVRTPQTKGKVESSNRFVNWLGAFDGKVSCLAEVARKLAALERECNSAPNRETGVPPLALLGRERESLRRLPGRVVLETYAAERYVTQKVPQTMLVRCRSKEYSVPRSMIGKRAVAIPSEGRVYVFDSAGELVAEHGEGASRINYSREHYLEGLSDKSFGDDLEEMAVRSLERPNYRARLMNAFGA